MGEGLGEGAGDSGEAAAIADHEFVQRHWELFCLADGENGAGAGEDDGVVGGPEGGELDLFELVEVFIEVLDEGVVAAHLFAALELGELGGEGAVVGGGEGDEAGGAIEAAESL